MNSQLKAKIFAPYCYVAKYYRVNNDYINTLSEKHIRVLNYRDLEQINKGMYPEASIGVKLLDNISEEDTIGVINTFAMEGWLKLPQATGIKAMVKEGLKNGFSNKVSVQRLFMDNVFEIQQYLISKNYAINFSKYSVEDLIKEGVYKII